MNVIEKIRGVPHNFFRRDLPSRGYHKRELIDGAFMSLFTLVSVFELLDGDPLDTIPWLGAAFLAASELIRNGNNSMRSSKREHQQQLMMAQQTFQERLQDEVPGKGYEIVKALAIAEEVAGDHGIETIKFLEEWVGSLGIEE